MSEPDGLESLREKASQVLEKQGREYIAAKDSGRQYHNLWYRGTIKAEDNEKPWVYVKVHEGLCSAAYHSLSSEGVDCKPIYDKPHISLFRKGEVAELKKKFGDKWKGAAMDGQPVKFRLQKIVSVVPNGWDKYDRVWFIEVESPRLRQLRSSLGFPELPESDDGDQSLRFHITFAGKPASHIKHAEIAALADAASVDPIPPVKRSTNPGKHILDVFNKIELDPEVTTATLGQPYGNAGIDTLLRTSQKLLNINQGTEDVDDRDSLAFQTFHSPEDFFAERINRDAGGVGRKMLWKATNRGNLRHIPVGALTPQLRSVLLNSGMGSPLEEINPLDIYDQKTRITRLGEGGMSMEAVPEEARSVQPSHFGFIDPVKMPESEKMGIDARAAHRVMRGSDGQLYTPMMNLRTGVEEPVSATQASKSVVAFPGEMAKDTPKVRAMDRAKQVIYVDRNKVDYELQHPVQMFSATSNLVPLISGIKGGRLLMGAKYPIQSLALQNPEAPLVRSQAEDGKSFVEKYGKHVGAVHAQQDGVVEAVSSKNIKIRQADGTGQDHELYENFPFNRKSYVHNTPVVTVGQKVGKDQLLAHSNFTDKEGNLAIGTNLRTAYIPYRGLNYEDAVIISESAAKRLTSEHMYQNQAEKADNVTYGRKQFVSLYPAKFEKHQLANIDDAGVIRVGSKVKKGDPLVLGVKQNENSPIHKGHKPMFSDSTMTWDHDLPGTVTDIDTTKEGGYNITVKAYAPMTTGDKIAGSFGDKGVISRILPDSQMPHDKDGLPTEMIANPLGLVSRINPSQVYEALLGKVARKTGKPLLIPGFLGQNLHEYTRKALNDVGMSDTEELTDPVTGKKIPKVLTGERFMMKLHHTAESKISGRDTGSYTSEGLPARGGSEGAKRVSNMEQNSLISHGATDVLRDAQVVRGQRNDEYWKAFRLGYTPPAPKIPLVYEKFLASLKGAGVNVSKDGNKLHLFALTDKDVDKMSSGEILTGATVTGDKLDPVKGGLFDESLTGGHGGNRYTHIKLSEPLPNPVMEDPIRRLLGLTGKQYEEVLSGKRRIGDATGGEGIRNALQKINLDTEIRHRESTITDGPKSKRDNSIKALGYLKTLKEHNLRPEDWVMTKWPVIPPALRPITNFKKMQLIADPNYLYRDMLQANRDLGELKDTLGREHIGDERLQVYNAMKAVAGLGDPIQAKTQEKNTKGLLMSVFGTSPKTGAFQRRVMGSPVDVVGRSVITPNPDLNMDQVGLPEKSAWTIYRPFIIRNLIRRGMPAVEAAKAVASQSKIAREALMDETTKRPMLINRAPTLHRYGFMAAWPVLHKGDTLQLPPVITAGLGADFDGNCISGESKLAVAFKLECGTVKDVKESIQRRYCMKFSGETLVLSQRPDAALVEMEIKDFPLIASTGKKDAHGADVYDVPEGVSVWTMDTLTGQPKMSAVTGLTVEENCKVAKVTTRRGFEVIASMNESLCCYDHAVEEIVKATPEGAEERLVPVIRQIPVTGTVGDFEFGWMLGAFVSDGFISGDQMIGYTKLSDAHRERFAKALMAFEGRTIAYNTYREGAYSGKLGNSAKDHFNHCEKALELFRTCYTERRGEGRAALYKQIPLLGQLSREAMFGLLTGLIDGDGSVSFSKAKDKPQLLVTFSTSSETLRDDVIRVMRLTGVRGNYSVGHPKEGRLQKVDAYTLYLSTVDLQRCWHELKFTTASYAKAFEELGTSPAMKDDIDPVPVPYGLMQLCASKMGPCKAHSSLVSTLSTAKSKCKKAPYTGRATAKRMLECLDMSNPRIAAWAKLVNEPGLGWDVIETVEDAGTIRVFDLIVPETKVFAVNGGLVVYDTMNFHVPVTDEAVKDATDKMLPSKNLHSVRDFQVHYLPRHEFVMGLYLASTAKNKEKQHRVFRSQADVVNAFHRGELHVGDPVSVKSDDKP